MAKAVGRDVIVKLMSDVAELRQDMEAMTGAVEVIAGGVKSLAMATRKAETHLSRMAKMLGKLADDRDELREELRLLGARVAELEQRH